MSHLHKAMKCLGGVHAEFFAIELESALGLKGISIYGHRLGDRHISGHTVKRDIASDDNLERSILKTAFDGRAPESNIRILCGFKNYLVDLAVDGLLFLVCKYRAGFLTRSRLDVHGERSRIDRFERERSLAAEIFCRDAMAAAFEIRDAGPVGIHDKSTFSGI